MPYIKSKTKQLPKSPHQSTKEKPIVPPLNYHPSDIPHHTIRKIYEDELMDVFNQELHPDTKVTVCYSRPKTIQDIVAKAAHFQVEGKELWGSYEILLTSLFYSLPGHLHNYVGDQIS